MVEFVMQNFKKFWIRVNDNVFSYGLSWFRFAILTVDDLPISHEIFKDVDFAIIFCLIGLLSLFNEIPVSQPTFSLNFY